jgi:tRNA-splicing ligase RtcB
MQQKRGEQVKKELELKGQIVKGASWAGLAEEAPEAYKNIDDVVGAVELSGIGKKIAKHLPMAVMKG